MRRTVGICHSECREEPHSRWLRVFLKATLVLLLVISSLPALGHAQSNGMQQAQDIASLVAAGDQLFLQSKFEEAEAKYSEAVRVNPADPLPYVRWARLLSLDMRPLDAAARALMAVQLAPTNAEAHARLARARDWQGRYDEALMSAQQSITFDPNYAEGHAFLAEVYLDLGQSAQADAMANKALQLDPNNAEAHRSKAFILAAQNNLDGAIKEAERAAQLEPTLWVRFDDLATMLRLIGDHSQAAMFYQRAIDLRPKAASYTGMGLSYIELGQLPQALTALQSAVTLDPTYAQGQGALGLVYAQMGQCAQAMPYIQQALRLVPDLAVANQAQQLCGGSQGGVSLSPPAQAQTPIVVVISGTPGAPVQPPPQVVTVAPPPQVVTVAPPPPVVTVAPPPPPQPVVSGKFAYSVFDTGRRVYDVYLANADGSNRQRIIPEAGSPDLSPDGRQIAYRSWDDDSRGLYARGVDGSNQRVLTEHTYLEDTSPVWAPAADVIAFASRRESDRRPRIYLANPGGKSDWVVKRGAESAYGEAPNWLPDGRLIYNACLGNNCGLVIMNTDGGGPQLVSSDPADNNPDVAPDGSRFAFMSRRDGNWEVYTADLQGNNPIRLTNNPTNDGLPVWSPDSRSIAFASDRGGVWAIWVMNADGSNQRQLFALEGPLDGRVRQEPDYASRGWIDENISWVP